MPSLRHLLPVFAAALLVGCAPNKAAPAENGRAVLPSLQARYQRMYPGSRLGLVIAADPQFRLVAVGDLKPSDFRVNQIVTFIDPQENVLTTGTVVRLLPDAIHVKYDVPQPGHRAPRAGDIMIRFKPSI